MAQERSPLPLFQQPVRLFLAGGALLCLLATLVLWMQPQPELRWLHERLAAGSAAATVVFLWFARAESRLQMADRVLVAALVGIALVMALAWYLGTGLRTIVLGIMPLLVGLTMLLAGGWRALAVTVASGLGIALLAWQDHLAGPGWMTTALTRLTPSSAIWAHVVLLIGGLVFGATARVLAQRWRGLADDREHQFRELLASAADRYFELDADLRFAAPSIEVPSSAGPLPAAFVGRHPWDTPGLRIEPERVQGHREELRARRPFEIEFESQSGPEAPVERLLISGRPRFSNQGVFLGYWCAGRNITAQQRQREATERATAEAEAASRAKSRFLASMSHEVRTPLNGIVGLARLAHQHLDERERLVHYLGLIGSSADALHALLTDVLDLTRAEASQLTLTMQSVDLPALLGDVHQVHEALCRARGLQCTLAMPIDLPRHVLTDGVRVRQILTNFLHNALKFTQRGRIGIEVSLLDGGRWRFAVQDTGLGMAASDLPELFQPFRQLEGATPQLHGGSGLGLSICRQLAIALGGEVGVSSTIGQGSRFWVDLPLQPCEPPPPDAPAAPRSLAGLRALVVEDNPVNMLIAVATLEDWGLQVEQAEDGQAALARVDASVAAGRAFDVVLMDLQMPGIDGFAATRALRARGLRVPVVALTATVMDEVLEQAHEAGIDEVMGKPIEVGRLRELLGTLVPG